MVPMRKRYRILILAAIVAALAVPLGFALSLESTATAVVAPQVAEIAVVSASTKNAAPLLVGETARSRSVLPPLPDGAKLFVVGSALFGLAAAMRRAA